jgi:formate dehydrogenase subunit gamma
VHAASFVVIGMFLIVHLYLSLLPMNRQSLNAMFEDGRLPIDYVKSHHPIWYEKLTGKKPEQTSAEKVEPSVAEEELTTS